MRIVRPVPSTVSVGHKAKSSGRKVFQHDERANPKGDMTFNRRLFGATVRDYAKSQPGKAFLSEQFNLGGFSCPPLQRAVEFPSVCDPNILGASFDQLLLFLVGRQSKGVEFEHPLLRVLPDRRCSEARNIKHYLTGGQLSAGLLDYLVRSAVVHQKSCSNKRGRGKAMPFIEYREALEALHELAMHLDWSAKRFLYPGHLASISNFAVRADLIVDDMLVEVKATKDAQHHSEHVAQLLAYYLVSQSPTRKPHEFQIDELAIYYARHGTLVRQAVGPLLRFPKGHLKRVAFDFLVGFEFWRDYGRSEDAAAKRMSELSDASFNQTLKTVYPRPDWLAVRLENEAAQIRKANSIRRQPHRIQIPDDFLVED